MSVLDRIEGALLGLVAGDALGATVEFMTPAQINARHGRHDDIVGGGAFGWRPGQGTDDSDLAIALARTYAAGYTAESAADAFLEWYRTGPRDIGGTTARALSAYQRDGDTHRSGATAVGPNSAGNGSLMRALATGLVVGDATTRARHAAEISAITHADQRCIDACITYCDLAASLVDGLDPVAATNAAAGGAPAESPVIDLLSAAPDARLEDLPTTGYVLHSLAVAVWAIHQDRSTDDLLIDIVNRGDDADTTAAIAGGLLGARDGSTAIPDRWANKLEYAPEARALADALHAARDTARAPRGGLEWVGAHVMADEALQAFSCGPRAVAALGGPVAVGHHDVHGWQVLALRAHPDAHLS